MKKVLVVVNAVGVTPVVCQEFSRRTVWEETVRRVASSAEYDALLVRLVGEGVLPPECGLPELRVSGNGSHAVLTALSGDHPGYDWYVFVSLSSAFLDPSLIGHFVQVGERQLAHYVYGEHFPRGMAPEVLSAEASVLKTRRRADEVYRLMNESENPAERDRCLLIYIPRRRGATEDEKMRDPFEVYAMAGAAFGDTEDQKIESLARQAMPQKAEEITRL